LSSVRTENVILHTDCHSIIAAEASPAVSAVLTVVFSDLCIAVEPSEAFLVAI